MTDRDLLEAAARAAGTKAGWSAHDPFHLRDMVLQNGQRWNPLDSDADAFRLMVDCGMTVDAHSTLNQAVAVAPNGANACENLGTDKHAATRRAVVRAAAAMGGEG